MKPFYENTALFVPGTPGCKGTSSRRLAACPAPRESEVESHLISPGISFRLPPRGATVHRGFPGFNARPMAGQKYHCPSLRIIALPGAARQLQSALFAPSPRGDLGGISGSALAPHPAAGVDRMKCVFGCQGAKAKGMGEGIFSLHTLPHLRAQNATLI